MFRAALLLTLATTQAIPSLAGGMTLCLHGDGSYCLETEAGCCCDHRPEPATIDSCCGTHPPADEPAPASLSQLPCDCTHLAIPGNPVVIGKSRGSEEVLARLPWQAAIVAWTPDLSAALRDHSGDSACRAGSGPSAALLFLAPVVLRC